MAARLKDSWVRLFPLPGRAVQAVWLLFMLPAVSLALAGIAPFYQLLQTICTGEVCVNGQLTPAEAQVNLDFSASPITYADLALSVYLFTYLLIFLTAVTLIWLKPAHGAAVCGAFCLTALATGNLALAATQISFALLIPVQFIHWVQLATLLPFIALIPDGRFHPSWLQWVALAVIPVAFLVAFGLVGMNSAQLVGALIGLLIVSMEIARYRWLPASPQREQMVWAVTAVALLAGAQWMGRPVQLLPLPALPLGAITTAPFFYPIFGLLLLVGALACLMVALLGDELFRLEVALNRALVYSLLTLFVVGAYVLIVGYLSLLFRASDNLWLSLIATGLVAALFQPVRAWVQRFVNGMLYGARDTPYAVIAGLGRRLEAAFVPESILPTIAGTVRESLQLPYVAIALERDGALGLAPGE